MNKANEMRMAGNAAMEQNNYGKAIEIYTAALLVSNNTVEEKSLIYSNRSHAYLQSAIASGDDSEADAQLQLALQDANDVIKVRSTWWKGYARAGNIYKHRKEWNRAIFSFNEALALEPDLTEVKNCHDECRWEEIRTEMSGNFMSHGLKEEIKKVNEVHETQFNFENITNNFEKLMESKDPECRANASVFFGVRYLKGIHVPQDIKIGIDLLQEAVDAGSTEAMVELGVFYMEGKSVQLNIEKAVGLFDNAATVHPKHKDYLDEELHGITHAQFHIGLCFQDGIGRPLDYCQARRWYEKASESGHAGATNNVAILYAEGLGGEKSLVKAKQFFRLSARRGNRSAMESLAWMFLMEKDLVQAESWYVKAVEAGNVHSIQRKDNFYKVLKYIREFMGEMNIPTPSSESVGVATASPAEAHLIEAIERVTKNKPTITTVEQLFTSVVAKYRNNLDEITRRAEIGHPFARTLLKSMSYFSEGAEQLKQLCWMEAGAEDVAFTEGECILNLAISFRGIELVSFFEPSQLKRLVDICKARISNQKSDLDLAARIVYCVLQTFSEDSEELTFSRKCCQTYPEEALFYKAEAVSFIKKKNFEASLKACDHGLQKFPTNANLFFCKAVGVMETCREEQTIAAFKDFIKHAPFDHYLIPEAYYIIALCASSDEKHFYYKKGVEAEQKMIPCFLPYESHIKLFLEHITTKNEKNGQLKTTTKTAEPNLQSSGPVNNLQLTNPARIQFVRRHREAFQTFVELSSTTNFSVQLSIKLQKEEKLTECPDDFKAITLRDMDPHKGAVYKKRFINLLISEDPIFGLLRKIHVIVRDDNDDCINCSFNHLDLFDGTVRQTLSFGSKITVLNIRYQPSLDGGVSLLVDDPKTIIYRTAGKDNPICRYCWKENASHRCGICKRAMYCSRSCQIDDCKIMKHELICRLKYFDSM